MSEPKKKTPWLYLVVAGVVLTPVFYVLSIGPVIWLGKRGLFPEVMKDAWGIYVGPFNRLYIHGPEWWADLVDVYLNLWR